MLPDGEEFSRIGTALEARLVSAFERVNGPLDMRTSDAVLAYSIASDVFRPHLVESHRLLAAAEAALQSGELSDDLRTAVDNPRAVYLALDGE